MTRFTRATAAFVVACAVSASAQNFRTGRVYNTNGGEISVVPRSQLTYLYTWYGPEIFQHPEGDLGLLAHSGNPSVERFGTSDPMGIASAACGSFAPAGIDTIYSARRDSQNGSWATPAFGQCPKFKGMGRRPGCTYDPQVEGAYNIDPVGSPSVVRIPNGAGWRYFLAFSNGNSDYITGKIYWAVSDDGLNWTIYNWNAPAYHEWTPILGPKYRDCEYPMSEIGKTTGVVEPFLAFDASDTAGGRNPYGTFYLYFTYSHYVSSTSHFEDALAYRFGYNPAHPFGFGANPEIFFDGQWRAHSGQLVWDYDGQPAVGTDPVLRIDASISSWRNASPHALGRGDLKQNTTTGVWYHISTWGNQTVIQSSSRLDMNNWSTPTVVNTASVNGIYSNLCRTGSGTNEYVAYDPGIWYGTLGGRTGWWIWMPVHTAPPEISGQPPGCFQGLALVVAKLCEGAEAGCDS